MIAGMNNSGKYGAELKFSVKSMDVMKVMVKSDSKSSNDALKGTMAQIKGEDYTDLQADAPDIKETNTIMEGIICGIFGLDACGMLMQACVY